MEILIPLFESQDLLFERGGNSMLGKVNARSRDAEGLFEWINLLLGGGVEVLDATDPDSLLRVGGYSQHQSVNDLELVGDYCFAAIAGSGLGAPGLGLQILQLDLREVSSPSLRVERSGPKVDVVYTAAPGWSLQSAGVLGSPTVWFTIDGSSLSTGTPANGEFRFDSWPTSEQIFFRLIKP